MVKISALPSDATPTGTDYIVVNDTESSNTKRVLLSNLVRMTTIYNEQVMASQTITAAAGMTNITNFTTGSITTYGGDVMLNLQLSYYRSVNDVTAFRLSFNSGAYYAPSSTGAKMFNNEATSHKFFGRTWIITSLPAGTYTVLLQGQALNSGNLNFDANDYGNLTAVEYAI